MILYGLIILVLVSLGLRNPVARPFDKDIVTVLKPLLALGIVLHHLHSQSVFLHEFERWGPVIVGFFSSFRAMDYIIHIIIILAI